MWRYLLFLLLLTDAFGQTSTAALDFSTKTLPVASVGRSYSATVKLVGGQGPFQWTLVKGTIPPGLRLQGDTGSIAGTPNQAGSFRFTLNVRDQSTNATITREFTLEVRGPLTLEWVEPPTLTENTISGSVKVTNSSSRDTFDLTVIIVAVNETGKAFALGYQRFDLAQNVEQTIPFASTLPNGRYIVHADAIAEVPARNSIFRARLQTSSPLVVNVNR